MPKALTALHPRVTRFVVPLGMVIVAERAVGALQGERKGDGEGGGGGGGRLLHQHKRTRANQDAQHKFAGPSLSAYLSTHVV